MSISKIVAREVLDSRGNPTVEVEVYTESGACGRAIVPSGASTGKHEAVELRDNDPSRFAGKGVRTAIKNIHERIAPAVIGKPATDQALIDRTLIDLDGTPNKANLGANAILGVSLACAHTAATVQGQPLWQYLDRDGRATMPMPMVNLISGGLHAGRQIEFQDFLLLPIGSRTFSEALEMTVAIYRALGEILRQNGFEFALVGDEGGYGPRLKNNEQAIEMILQAFTHAGCTPGRDAAIALDVAASHFYRDGVYHLEGKTLSSTEMVEFLRDWVERYPILSIEDGLAEDDWPGWQELTRTIGAKTQLIGDDLFVTNPQRLQKGIDLGAANSVLVKVNQIGTLTEALQVIDQARAAGCHIVVSARSGETEDTTIADLAVATGAGQIKIGSIVRSERLAKYNQLLRIEEQLGESRFARFPFDG